MFSSLFGRLLGARRRVLAAVLSAACIAIYTVLVGATASMVRAALMGGLSLFARQLGRGQDGLNSLGFVAALMALINPLSLGDPGFQLSFTASLGLILYAAPLTQAFTRLAARRLPGQTVRRLAGRCLHTIRAVELFALVPGRSIPLGDYSLLAVVIIYALILGWIWAAWRWWCGRRPFPRRMAGCTLQSQMWILATPSLCGRPPGAACWSTAGPAQGRYAARTLLEAVNEEGIPVKPAESGQGVDLGQGAWLRVLYAGERGAVLLLE